MTDRDQTVIYSLNGGSSEPDRLGFYDDFGATENRSASSAPGLVSLGFIRAAVRRSALFLFVMAVTGLVLGFGVYLASPHAYQAAASILVTLSPYEDSQSAAVNNQAMAQTRAVGQLAVQQLGLTQSVSSFLSSYIVTPITGRLLTITASAPSSNEAVLRANAVGNAFLKFRADELQAQQSLVVQSLNQQIRQAKQAVSSINAQVSQTTSTTSQSQVNKLKTEQTTATATLNSLQQALNANRSSTLPALMAAIKNSQVLSVAPASSSKTKGLVRYAAVGLVVGLALGLGIVIIRALVSSRLRRRDDIAYALNAPVKLSVGPLRTRRFLPSLPGRAAMLDLDMRRVVAHLQAAMPTSTEGPAGLAIVAVDNAEVVARAVAALAASSVRHGNQVVTVDLSSDAQLAHLLGVKGPGAHSVSDDGANFTVLVPDRHEVAPIGPLRPVTAPVGPGRPGDMLAAAYAAADLLLTLVTLDPALGGDYVATWATSAVAVVSAGQSSADRIHGVGEMVRLAGVRLDSVVLLGADKSDESLGLPDPADQPALIKRL